MPTSPSRARTLSALFVACIATFTAGSAIAGTPQVMIVTSDPQYPWTDKTDRGQEESPSEKEARSRELITEQYESIAAYRAARPDIDIPVVINGDLTAFGHGRERSVMNELLGILGDNVFLGLGNHDISNNVDDCVDNDCAIGSIENMISRMRPLRQYIRFPDIGDRIGLRNERRGSLSYMFTPPGFANVLNFQTHNFPGYENSFSRLVGTIYRLESGVPWLRNMLQDQLYKPEFDFGLVHMHDPRSITEDGRQALQQQKVKAIFAGHFHGRMGLYDYVGDIPIFLSGSASQRTYLVVEYDKDEHMLRVFGVRDNDPENKSLIQEIPV